MKNSVHDNGGFIGRVADYAAEDYYTVLQQGSAYEVANAAYTNVSISTGYTSTHGVVFSADGTKVYFQSAGNTNFATLSTPSDLSTASSLTSVSSGASSVQSITFNPTGTTVFYTDYGGNIHFASLSTASDLTTKGSQTTISSGISAIRDLQFNNDGTKLYLIKSGSIYSFPLASAYTITSTDVASTNRTTQSIAGADPQGFRFNSDGTKLFVIHGKDSPGSRIVEYSLSTAYDITTIGTAITHTTTASQVNDAHDFTFSHDGTNFYVVGVNSSNVYEYIAANTVNANKKNTGVWSMDADYLNAELNTSSLDIDAVYGTTYLREFTSFPSATFSSGSGGSGQVDVTWIFDMTFSTTDTGCLLDQGGGTDGLYLGMVSGGNLRLSTSGAVSGASNQTSTTTTDMSAYAGVAGQLIVTIDYQNHIQCWWNDSTNGINQIVSVDFNGDGDWAGGNSARVGQGSSTGTNVHGGQDPGAFTGTITRYREITAYVDTSTF